MSREKKKKKKKRAKRGPTAPGMASLTFVRILTWGFALAAAGSCCLTSMRTPALDPEPRAARQPLDPTQLELRVLDQPPAAQLEDGARRSSKDVFDFVPLQLAVAQCAPPPSESGCASGWHAAPRRHTHLGGTRCPIELPTGAAAGHSPAIRAARWAMLDW